MSDSGISKATFEDLEAGYGSFEVQYNPKEFKFNKKASWKEHEEQGSEGPPLEYQKNAPATLSMELFFDTTAEMGDGFDPEDVRDAWVNGLLQLTNPEVAQASGPDKKRPPKVKFIWGTFEMTAVVEKIDVTYLMFSANGTPVRARCAVTMKEWGTEEFDHASWGLDYELQDAKLVVAGADTTAYDLASQAGISTQAFCDLNGIVDPLADLIPGSEYVVSQAAEVASTASSVYESSAGLISAAESVVNNPSSAGSAVSAVTDAYDTFSDLF